MRASPVAIGENVAMVRYLESAAELRALFPPPGGRSVRKQLGRLDRHCRQFVGLSPFVVIATSNGENLDASPRGGPPGFVRIVDDVTFHIPDSPGNNRLDSLTNIVMTPKIGLLFLIPGVDETLRVNGSARVTADPCVLRQFDGMSRPPRVVIEVAVEEVYLHCAKALMRSRLWSDDARVERSVLPTMGEMLAEQLGSPHAHETQEEMVARYRKDL